MTNSEIAAALDHLADLLEYRGENVFRVRAYRKAARTVGTLVESLASVRADPQRALTDLEGIGADLAGKIEALLDTGRLPLLEELERQVPAAVFELMRVPGLGPKKVKSLVDGLGIDSLDGLERACREGRVRGVQGFGAKTEAAILDNIAFAKSPEHARLLWQDADAIAAMMLAWMRQCPQARQVEGAGSWRRGRETVGDLDLVVDSSESAAVIDHFCRWSEAAAVLQRGDTKASIRGPRDVQIDLRVVERDSFGAALQYFTGSKEHNVRLRSRARTGTFLEINANPWRLDLDDRHAAAAKRAGVKVVISTDAHSTAGLDVMRCGVLQARRGGLEADDVVNTRTLAGLKKLLTRRG